MLQSVLKLLMGFYVLCVMGCASATVYSTDSGLVDSTLRDAQPSDHPLATSTDTSTLDSGSVVIGSCNVQFGTCNPTNNAGCAAGEACYLYADLQGQSTRCLSPGTSDLGESCQLSNACRPGLACLLDHHNNPICSRLCCGPNDDNRCRVDGMIHSYCPVLSPSIPFQTCQLDAQCDWFTQNCPQPNHTCVPQRTDGVTQCIETNNRLEGDFCDAFATNCGPGLLCTNDAEGRGMCRQICDPTASSTDTRPHRRCLNPIYSQCRPVEGLPSNFGVCG